MELIKLTPRLGVDPSLRLRSPGEVLSHDYMRPESINPAQLARRTGIQARHIKELIAGSRRVTPKYAIRLAAVLPTSALYWLVLQARYDLAREERDIATTVPMLDPPSRRS
ncbi:HigA family addiction module antitoxin [Dyella jiangningensis]|uniref:Addiction module antidote protein, HigA family n=1 Tax=Dyella jiangningensis TaxID=1379159 RepID=A0A328NXF3_9GAMM|nr:HigA family addiction module antitoxin [Dyella jiangningensis]RAO74920.1 addiction module antidote protein, HigA family [Dyella jiangningensis]